MTLSISNGVKNNLTITNGAKGNPNLTWDEATFMWDDAGSSTWDAIKTLVDFDVKNNLTITNGVKN